MFNMNGGLFLNSKEIMHLVTSQFCILYINFRSEQGRTQGGSLGLKPPP